MKRSILNTCLAAMVMLLTLAACRRGDDYTLHTRYLPVQLQGSERWSLLDVSDGRVLARDAFATAPSAVVDDMFYVINDDGTVDYYNVAAPTERVNSESYGSATPFGDNGLAVASLRGGPLTVIDKQCRVVATLPRNVAQCTMYYRGLAAYQTDDGLWGYLDELGDTVIPARYAQANAFLNSDLAVVVDAEQAADTVPQFSVIDRNGRTLFTAGVAEYGLIRPYYVSGVLPVVKGDTIVCLDAAGVEVSNPNDSHRAVDQAGYDDYTRTPAGLFIVLKDGKMGLVDSDNRTLIAPTCDRLIDITADRYIAMTDTVCRLVDRDGRDVGNARFVHAHGTLDVTQAARGFIDTSLAAAAMLMMLGPNYCCGASPATTLMDMNAAINASADALNGQNSLITQQGPFVIRYVFNNYIASPPAEGAPAQFNYGARVMAVTITLNVAHCGLKTEPDLTDKLSSALGTRGFVLDTGTLFTSEAGTAVSLGYGYGLVHLYYYMNRSYAQQLPRTPRH